ncbi:hypothetical protein EJ08DRAFT_735059 [Tothia fuscella]|uniref:Mediator of RNA polymerase II transcription subunit 13 n=1 Tax=Tothia fuscella TaxID=1048955 RepID=A0A9P4TWI4_9PEZI|nr:hypothetical protein EJ08DRAFT_735059 [Tothia fuscella]
MEFLKNYNTSVQTLSGYSTIQYHVYAIERQPEARTDDASLEDVLASLTSQLRARKCLVYADETRYALWRFRIQRQAGGGEGGFNNGPLDEGFAEPVKNTALKSLFHGTLNSSELIQCFNRPPLSNMNNNPSTPTSASPSTPTAALRAAQLANLRAFQQNASAPGQAQDPATFPMLNTDIRSMYALFIKAVLATVEYWFARHHSVLRLDAGAFVTVEDVGSGERHAKPFKLDVYLSTGGTLVFSAAVDEKRHLRYLSAQCTRDEDTVVYLAVGGMPALLYDDPSCGDEADTIAWKEIVKEKLELLGIYLADLDLDESWTFVRAYLDSEQHDTRGDAMANPGVTFYWPTCLCFIEDGNTSPSLPTTSSLNKVTDGHSALFGTSDPSTWFSSPDQGGYMDPIAFAEQWYLAKPTRDATIEERQRKRTVEAEAAAARQAEYAALNITSSFNTRGDLQATGGVYPTPPDGIPPHMGSTPLNPDLHIPTTISGSSDVQMSDQSAAQPGIDYAAGEAMDMDAFDGAEGKAREESLLSRGSLTLEPGMNIFGEMDDEVEYIPNDITDADFDNFFDGPDDEEMGDVGEEVDGDDGGGVELPVMDTEPKVEDTTEMLDSGDIAVEDPRPQAATDFTDSTAVEIAPPPPTQDTDVVPDTPAPKIAQPKAQMEVATVKSPLSPTCVRKKLFEIGLADKSTSLARRHSTFDPVPFNTDLSKQDAKYSTDGAFAFSPPPASAKRTHPKIGNALLPPRKKRMKNKLIYKGPEKQNNNAKDQMWDSDESVDSDDSANSSFSDFESLSLEASPTKRGYGGRSWNGDDGDTSVATSPGNYVGDKGEMGGMGGSRKDRIDLLSRILTPTPSQQRPLLVPPQKQEPEHLLMLNPTLSASSPGNAFAMIPSPITLPSDPALQITHKDFISVAQIVADQIIFGAIDLSSSSSSLQIDLEGLALDDGGVSVVNEAQKALGSFMKDSTKCDLPAMLRIADAVGEKSGTVNSKNAPNLPRKPTNPSASDNRIGSGAAIPSNLVISLPVPHLRIHRNDILWDVLPPALPFWDYLGLAPASGRKNIVYVGVVPDNGDLKDSVDTFLNYLGATYEGGKLGSHTRVDKIIADDGLMSWSADGEYSFQGVMAELRKTCAELGKVLAGVDWGSQEEGGSGGDEGAVVDDIIVYIVNPFDDDLKSIPYLCSAFWTLYETYRHALSTARSPTRPKAGVAGIGEEGPDIVLQILPISSIARADCPVVETHSFFQKLARQVYDRCPPTAASRQTKEIAALTIDAASAIRLETPLLKHIQFKTTGGSDVDLMRDPGFLNVAYGLSGNGEWCTAAWTDPVGRYQATVSYCLIGRTFFEIAREIWGTTVGIMEARRCAWRICVGKVGEAMGREEIDAWAQLSTAPTQYSMLTILACINTSPTFSIFPKPSSASNHANTFATPSATPATAAQTVSPDNTTHALTPAATPASSAIDAAFDIANDADAKLVDVGDEVTGVVLAHRKNVSGKIDEFRPSLSSGYLVKRRRGGGAPLDDDFESPEIMEGGPADVISVDILWIGGVGRNNTTQNTSAGAANTNTNTTPQPSPSLPLPSPSSALATFGPGSYFSPIAIDPTLTVPSSSAPAGLPSAQPTTPMATGGPIGVGGSHIHKAHTDQILRDYLAMFRNLGELARGRGMRGSRGGFVPWHVLVVERGLGGLEGGYGGLGWDVKEAEDKGIYCGELKALGRR